MRSVITARWERETEREAIDLEVHILDWVNSGLTELCVIHFEEPAGNETREQELMSLTHADIEREANEKGLNAPRVTQELVESRIVREQYYQFPDTTVTVCLLTLKNGFSVHGVSAAASPENFDEELGRKIARDRAESEIWKFEGYLLRERLSVVRLEHRERIGQVLQDSGHDHDFA